MLFLQSRIDKGNNLWVGYVKGGVEVFDENRNKKFDLERPDFPYAGIN
jgi:hypothetical protein